MADRDRPQDDSDEDLDERQEEAQRELDKVPPHGTDPLHEGP
jgi:hypothetical protein